MSYLKSACSKNRMHEESNESVYGRFGVFSIDVQWS